MKENLVVGCRPNAVRTHTSLNSIAGRQRVTVRLMGKFLISTGAVLCRAAASAAKQWISAKRIMVMTA